MTSPILDEAVIIDALEHCDNEMKHGSGLLMLLVDAYDREITRDQFIASVSSAISCADNIGRHSLVCGIKKFLIANSYTISPADIETAVAQTSDLLKRSTADCLKMARLLAQCPTDEDRIQ